MNPIESVDRVRRRVVASTVGLFAHAEDPLANTLAHAGDPGLFGPDSVTWRVMGDPATFVGGIRALMIQAAHPEVAAGVSDHSRYREDPLGRLSRTSNYVTATAYGAMPEVEAAIRAVRRAHTGVSGTSHRAMRYAASDPELAAWVHNTLTDSFLQANQTYGKVKLTPEDADLFVAEQSRVGRLLDADPLPETAQGLAMYVADHPRLAPSPGATQAMEFLAKPPLTPLVSIGYRVLAGAAAAIIPSRIRDVLEIEVPRLSESRGRAMVTALQWALGASPRWRMALLRVGADIPEGIFKQKAPFEDLDPGQPARSDLTDSVDEAAGTSSTKLAPPPRGS